DREDVLQRAAASGVSTLVCVGATGPAQTNARALALVGRQGPVGIVATVGVHPHHASTADDAAFALLERLARAPGVVAIGETGLDFHYNFSPPAAQRAAFARTVALARAVGLPLVVHVREAHVEAAELLGAEGAAAVGGVIHCFTGGRDDARRYLDLGFHISVAGIVTFKNADALRAAVRAVPRDRLLVETDAPYLAPVPHRGRRNEPADMREGFDARDEGRREPVVHARPVVERESPALLAHGGQLEAGVQIDGESPEVARHDGPELDLEIRLAPVRHLRLDVPAEVERKASFLEKATARPHPRTRVLELVAVQAFEVGIGRHVDLVGEAVVVLDGGAQEPVAARLLALRLLFVRAASLGDEGGQVLHLVQALPFGGRRVDLELEEVEGGRRHGRRQQAGDRDENECRPHLITAPAPGGMGERATQAAERAGPRSDALRAATSARCRAQPMAGR